jgi:hypothetical protein
MALTVKAGFEKLRSNLEITGLQKTTVSTRQQNVRAAVEAEMKVSDSFLTGSYARSTMIAPLKEADVDIFMVMGSDHYHWYSEDNGPAKMLDAVKRSLLKRYKTPKISRNGQAVSINFEDFVVDVVPAFPRKGEGYYIPDTERNQWIATNPKVHVDIISKQNGLHAYDLIPLLKMVKGWNRQLGNVFGSFYLELLATQILESVSIQDFSSGMWFFLDRGVSRIQHTIQDPVSYGGQIYGLRGIGVSDAVSRFNTALGRANKALEYDRAGKPWDAIAEWRKLFGDYFPTYG